MLKLFAVAGIAGMLLMTGCAPMQYTNANVDGMVVCNDREMDQVERKARRIYARVQWVNCPQMVLRTG